MFNILYKYYKSEIMYYIYRITNKVNGKTYVGQHKYKKLNDSYMGSGKLLKKAVKKYGIENFEKEILYSRIQYKETADDMERFAIAKERTLGKAEYNIANGGQGGNLGEEVNKKLRGKNNHFYGKHHSEETKKRISEAMKGKLSGRKGKHHSEEAKKKISEGRKGKPAWNKGKKGVQEAWNKGLKLGSNGTHWYNNGETNIKAKECPEGFVKGRLRIWL